MEAAEAPGAPCWVYYAAARDWCDHLLLHEDGGFERAALGAGGLWQLTQHRGGGLVLTLQWEDLRGRQWGVAKAGKAYNTLH